MPATSSLSSPYPMKNYFCGTSVALVTPFSSDGKIDYRSLGKVLERVLDARLEYIVLFGTTGESPTILREEKKKIIDFVVKKLQNSSTQLILGIGGNNTLAVGKELLSLEEESVSGILSVTPYYNKPTQEGLFRHFSHLAEKSSYPLIIYNIPGRTGVDLLPFTLFRLREAYPEKIVAIKDSTCSIERIRTLAKLMDPFFTILSGDDCHTLSFMRNGAKGAVSVLANAFPHLSKKIVDDSLKKDAQTEVETLNDTLCDLYKALFEDGNPAGIKHLLQEMGLIATQFLRPPLAEVSSLVAEHIKAAVELLKEKEYYRL